jgi:small subunit ribosomal protein S6
MHTYEFTFLVNKDDELKKLEELITSLAGTVEKKEDWGVKALAYPIKKIGSAHYYLWTIKLGNAASQKLRLTLNFNENIIRFLLLRLDK